MMLTRITACFTWKFKIVWNLQQAFPTIGSLSQNTPFSLLYHLYHFDTADQRHLYILSVLITS
jgi:hypothetical protein